MHPARRAVLLIAGLGAITGVSGCSDGGARRGDAPGGSRASSATASRARAAKDSTELLARYDATIAAHPGIAPALRALRAEVAQHAEAFESTAAPSGATPTPSGSPGAGPGSAVKAVTALADTEQRLADARATALLGAPPELAQLLASVAAAGAGHVLLLQATLKKIQKGD
jgi:hypothetical protein